MQTDPDELQPGQSSSEYGSGPGLFPVWAGPRSVVSFCHPDYELFRYKTSEIADEPTI